MLAFIPRAIFYIDPECVYASIPHRTPFSLYCSCVLFQRTIWSGRLPSVSLKALDGLFLLSVFGYSTSCVT